VFSKGDVEEQMGFPEKRWNVVTPTMWDRYPTSILFGKQNK